MGNTFFFPWEVDFMVWFQKAETAFTTKLGSFFTFFGEEALIIVVLGIIYWCYSKDVARKACYSLIGSVMVGSVIKKLVLRLRPYMVHSNIKCLRAVHPEDDLMDVRMQGYSMPSLHSAISMSAYGTLFRELKFKWLRIVCVFLPLMVGLSRCFLGVHYPTDVLAGWAFGFLMMLLTGFLDKRFGPTVTFIVLIVLGTVGVFFHPEKDFFVVYGFLIGFFLAFLYEKKYVNFKPATKWWGYLLRTVLGIGILLGIKALLKKLLGFIPGDEGSIGMLLLQQTLRYVIIAFVALGIYPKLFGWLNKKGFPI